MFEMYILDKKQQSKTLVNNIVTKNSSRGERKRKSVRHIKLFNLFWKSFPGTTIDVSVFYDWCFYASSFSCYWLFTMWLFTCVLNQFLVPHVLFERHLCLCNVAMRKMDVVTQKILKYFHFNLIDSIVLVHYNLKYRLSIN